MSRNFGHLNGSTKYPDTNVRPYEQYENDFDYTRWGPNTTIKLCHVNLTDDYNNTVKFRDDGERDAYYDNISDSITLTTSVYIQPGESVKVPIPFQTLRNYNYCYIDFGAEYPKNGGNLPHYDNAIKRYYYFVKNVENVSPSTSKAIITLDVWTTYINHIDINNLILERGHAAMKVTATQYLTNPLGNNDDLLAADVNYGNGAENISSAHDYAINGGRKYLCLACVFNPAQLTAMAGNAPATTQDSAPQYDGTGIVNVGYGYGAGGYDVSGQTAETSAYQSASDYTANGYDIYAIDLATMISDYIDDIFTRFPSIMHGIKAAFILSEKQMAKTSNAITVNGIVWTRIKNSNSKIADITLSKTDFNYPENIAEIAKLYTYPYAALEIVDNLGQSKTVKIEETGHMSLQSIVSVAWPILTNINYLSGVKSDEYSTVTITDVNGNQQTVSDDNGDVAATLLRYDIPTFALHLSGRNRKRANGYATEVMQTRGNSILSHDNAVRSANVGLSNTQNANATSVSNTARSGANAKSNNNESVNCNNDNVAKSNTQSSDIMQFGQDNATKLHDITNVNIQNSADLDTSTNTLLTDTDNNSTVQQTTAAVATGAATLIAGVAAGAATGGIGAVGMAAAGSQAASLGLTGYSSMVGMAKNKTQADQMNAATNGKALLAETMNDSVTEQHNKYIAQINDKQIQLSTDINNRNNTFATNVINNNVNTANANASDTASTSNANAQRSRNNSVDIANRNMVNTRDNVNAAYLAANLSPASDVSQNSGDGLADSIGKRRYMIKIKTQSKSAIMQTGTYFARYGIACNKIVEADNLITEKYFNYWKALDLWITSDIMTADDINIIHDIFIDGVTVWKTPNDIGRVNIYDNIGA
jgi:hypothetical protein